MVSKKSKAYLSHFEEGTSSSYHYIVTYIADRLEPENDRYRDGMIRLIAHIIGSMSNGTKFKTTGSDCVPIPYKLIRKLGGAIVWQLCLKHGLISYTEYVRPSGDKKGLCREYFLSHAFADGYFETIFKPARANEILSIVNLQTGKPSARQRRKSSMIDPVSRLPIPAKRDFEILSATEVELDIPRMLEEYDNHRKEVLLTDDPVDHIRLRQVQVLLTGIILEMRGRKFYRGAFDEAPAGRIYEQGGGIQALPERYKLAAFGDAIEKGLVKNFDNDTCHPRMVRRLASGINKRTYSRITESVGLMDLSKFGHQRYKKVLWDTFYEAGCDLSKFIFPFIPSNDEMKLYCTRRAYKNQLHADLLELGVPKYKCKTIINAIMYGMKNNGLKELHLGHDQIEQLHKTYPWAFQTAFLIHTWLEMACVDMLTRNQWKSISGTYPLYSNGSHAGDMFSITWIPRQGVHVVNKRGKKLRVIDAKGEAIVDEDGRKIDGPRILCHILHGCEITLWSHVITSSVDHGYIVLNPEHDGAVINVSGGEVPDEVFIEAIQKAGLGTAKAYGGKRTPKRIGNDACMIREKPFERVIKSRTPGRAEIAGMTIRKERPAERSNFQRGKGHKWYLSDIEVSAMEDSW